MASRNSAKVDVAEPAALSTGAVLNELLADTAATDAQVADAVALLEGTRGLPRPLKLAIARLPADAQRRCLLGDELARRASAIPRPTVLRGPDDVRALAQRSIGGRSRETVLVIVCDAANRPIDEIIVATGSVDRVLLPIREILHAVLRADGRAFAVAHNHPAGQREASFADIDAARSLRQAAEFAGLRFLGLAAVPARRVGSADGAELSIEHGMD